MVLRGPPSNDKTIDFVSPHMILKQLAFYLPDSIGFSLTTSIAIILIENIYLRLYVVNVSMIIYQILCIQHQYLRDYVQISSVCNYVELVSLIQCHVAMYWKQFIIMCQM